MGRFVLSSREREKREEIVVEIKERDRVERGTGMKVKKQKKFKHPLYPYQLQGQKALPNCKPISVGCPSDLRYTTPSPNLTLECQGTLRTSPIWVCTVCLGVSVPIIKVRGNVMAFYVFIRFLVLWFGH